MSRILTWNVTPPYTWLKDFGRGDWFPEYASKCFHHLILLVTFSLDEQYLPFDILISFLVILFFLSKRGISLKITTENELETYFKVDLR